MNMKLFVSLVALVVVVNTLPVSAQTPATGALIAWEKNIHDFGEITQGDKVEHSFKFTNSGSEPLLITNVQVTCGCTTPKGWPRDPIKPGEKVELIVMFNSAGKIGRQNKVVTVVSNAVGGNSQVTFTATVLEKKAVN
jgi:hypothetical protein